MTIRINQIAVEFTLENETVLADLTASLRAWAGDQNLAILGILADGRAVGPDDPTPLASVTEVDVEAVPVGERDLARVAVMARFFSLLVQGSDARDTSLLEELHREYPAVREALAALLEPLLPRLTKSLEVLDAPWTDVVAVGLAAKTVARETEARRKELQSPEGALSETFQALDKLLVPLADLGRLFQKGQDRDAFDRILDLFTLLEDTHRRIGLHLQNVPAGSAAWTAFHEELQPFLREAEAALGTADYILLTDLLEYEVTPRLGTLKTLFPEIANLDPVFGVL